jgi:hypothetical protein
MPVQRQLSFKSQAFDFTRVKIDCLFLLEEIAKTVSPKRKTNNYILTSLDFPNAELVIQWSDELSSFNEDDNYACFSDKPVYSLGLKDLKDKALTTDNPEFYFERQVTIALIQIQIYFSGLDKIEKIGKIWCKFGKIHLLFEDKTVISR